MAKAKKKKKKKKVAKKAKGLVGKTSKTGVMGTWLVAFGDKKLKTTAQVSAFMKAEFPGRESKIFEAKYVNTVVGRANRGLLSKGKTHSFKKYPVDKKKEK